MLATSSTHAGANGNKGEDEECDRKTTRTTAMRKRDGECGSQGICYDWRESNRQGLCSD